MTVHTHPPTVPMMKTIVSAGVIPRGSKTGLTSAARPVSAAAAAAAATVDASAGATRDSNIRGGGGTRDAPARVKATRYTGIIDGIM